MLPHKLKIKNYVYKILTIIIKFALKTTKAVFIMSYRYFVAESQKQLKLKLIFLFALDKGIAPAF